jgi:hypothetical protein
LRKVLTGEGEDGRSVGRSESHVVGGGSLVSVSRTPDVAVGKSAEVGDGLDRLVSGSILTCIRSISSRLRE